MKLSRSELLTIVGGELVDEYSSCHEDRVQECLNCFITGLVAKGLEYTERSNVFHTSGRPEQVYNAQHLADKIDTYLLDAWSRKKMTLRKAMALSIVAHLDMMGYFPNRRVELNPDEVHLNKGEQMRINIFGRKKAKEYREKMGV